MHPAHFQRDVCDKTLLSFMILLLPKVVPYRSLFSQKKIEKPASCMHRVFVGWVMNTVCIHNHAWTKTRCKGAVVHLKERTSEQCYTSFKHSRHVQGIPSSMA